MVYADAEMFGVGYRAGESFLEYNPPEGELTRRRLIEGRCIILPSGSLIKNRRLNGRAVSTRKSGARKISICGCG